MRQGIICTKAFAGSYLWRTKLDSDLESLISSCLVCTAVQQEPAKSTFSRVVIFK